ncbi:Acetyl-coenzyme A synthetase [Pseudomonas fluorescens]|uniref:Acetyl-coenzyme A synthetase n=1 Tax=Pseudomonas fluorescens TaxID=294 RepID=A0A8H2RS41_PSEFL|nr:acetoacetate--CoA ligase [Pseudomonas fluorescens]VVP13711.1 Acetyl-coenzyme A synthetase [Pseudomonas fluorescens]
MNQTATQPAVLWRPTAEAIENAQITRFARSIGMEPLPYERLHRHSISKPGDFWEAFWNFSGMVGEGGGPALTPSISAPMTDAEFFPARRLNFAENMLVGGAETLAVIEANEGGITNKVTLGELRIRVARAQLGLKNLGLESGDRVAGMLPNDLNALVMLLAVTSLGAVWSSCSPEFGYAGVIDRFGQISPKLFVVASDYLYNGRRHDIAGKSADIARSLPGLQQIIVIGDAEVVDAPFPVHRFADICNNDASEPSYVRVPFNHPLYIVFTSGTTGLPKCIVHRTGGTLLNLRKEHMLHCDIKPGDCMLYYTNTAWMMYHWLITARASGATIVLYDGSPIPKVDGQLDHGALWRVAEKVGATHFGISPKYLTLLQQDSYKPRQKHDLKSLRMIVSSGAPLTAENSEWVYREVKDDLCLASISGGTEILGCFGISNPTLPVRAGEIQVMALGMAVNVLDERNAPVWGRKGDLVCTEPFPSMPLEFLGENGRQRYLDTYFADRSEIWTHGDLAEITETGGLIISGRTDTTLKPGGVRIGTGEIYRVIDTISAIEDSLVIGYPVDDDMEIWLFVVTKQGIELDEELERIIARTLKFSASPRHVPRRIFSVPEVPYTLSGKKVEKAVLQFITGCEVKNKGSLMNPDCLSAFLVAVNERAPQMSGVAP